MKKTRENFQKIDTLLSNKSAFLEAYQKVLVNISFAAVDRDLKVIAVTSSHKGDGKSTTLCNLANCYKQNDKKVVVIDLDLRRSVIHRHYGLPNDVGIVDYVAGDIKLKDIISTVDGVDVICAGTNTPFPTKILESNKLVELIEELKKTYDVILVDTPPVLVVTDALVISKFIDGYINVVSYGKTKKKDLKETINQLKGINAEIIGAVMTRVKIKDKTYYYNY